MVRRFVDSSVLLLAVGREAPERDACRAFLTRAAANGDHLHISVEAAQEYVFHRTRRMGRAIALTEGARLCQSYVMHEFTIDIYRRSLDLMGSSTIRGRDAVHAATAVLAGFSEIVSADRDFGDVPGLTCVAPADAAQD